MINVALPRANAVFIDPERIGDAETFCIARTLNANIAGLLCSKLRHAVGHFTIAIIIAHALRRKRNNEVGRLGCMSEALRRHLLFPALQFGDQ
jgi:hypothetical protein